MFLCLGKCIASVYIFVFWWTQVKSKGDRKRKTNGMLLLGRHGRNPTPGGSTTTHSPSGHLQVTQQHKQHPDEVWPYKCISAELVGAHNMGCIPTLYNWWWGNSVHCLVQSKCQYFFNRWTARLDLYHFAILTSLVAEFLLQHWDL